eukprot:5528644-Lingulodinium_polyedra.AAC.1
MATPLCWPPWDPRWANEATTSVCGIRPASQTTATTASQRVSCSKTVDLRATAFSITLPSAAACGVRGL